MAFIIPWIFRAGTKAKSAEVNENFLAVKQFVDLLEEDVAANQIMVQTLDDTKANVNGNPTERFQVATAIVGNDAVNLNTLEKNTQNARGYIDGYRLSATSKKVTASKGSCYSYNPQTEEYEYLIKSNAAVVSETLTLGGDATYYIFICGDSAGVEYPKLSIGTNNTTPSLPAGLDCWRRIGHLITDEDGNIDEIYNENDQVIPKRVGFIGNFLGAVTVDHTKKDGEEYEAEESMWLYVKSPDNANTGAGTVIIQIKIQETWREVARLGRWSDFDNDPSSTLIPIKKGQEYKLKADGNTDKTVYKYAME